MRLYSGSPKKKDANQNNIAQALEMAGCTVIDASPIGGGFPDLIVGRAGATYLIEVKNTEARGKLNKRQQKFFDTWLGQVATAYTVDDAFEIVGVQWI